MGSILGKNMRKVLACILALSLVVGLNPAAALAQGEPSTTPEPWVGSETTSSAIGGTSGQIGTDIYVNVKTYFKATMDSTDINIQSASELDTASVSATLSGGKPFTDKGDLYYKVKWIRETIGQDGAVTETITVSDTQVGNIADKDDLKNVATATYDLSDLSSLLDGNGELPDASYRYHVEAEDATNCAVASAGVIVNTSKNYIIDTVANAASKVQADALVYAQGTNILTTDTPAKQILNDMIKKAAGSNLTLEQAYELVITNDVAATNNKPAVKSVSNLYIPITKEQADAASSATSPVRPIIYKIEQKTSDGKTSLELVQVDDSKVKIVSNESTHEYFAKVEGVVSPWIYGIAFPNESVEQNSVTITSEVANIGTDESPIYGGNIDILGENTWSRKVSGQDNVVRYTFTPNKGYELEKVELKSTTSGVNFTRTYDAASLDGANYLDLNIASLDGSINTATLTATYKEMPKQEDKYMLVAEPVNNGEAKGTISITTNKGEGDEPFTSPGNVSANASATLKFIPEAGSKLDHVEISYGNNANYKPVAVENSTLYLPQLTKDAYVKAFFVIGTPVTYEDLHVANKVINSEGITGEILSGTTAAYGEPFNVNVNYTLDSDYENPQVLVYYQIKGAGAKFDVSYSGNNTYTIPSVTQDITVTAEFTAQKIQHDQPATSATFGLGEGVASATIIYKKNAGEGTVENTVTLPSEGGATSQTINDINKNSESVFVSVTTDTGYTIPVNVSGIEPAPSASSDGLSFTIPVSSLVSNPTISFAATKVIPKTITVNTSAKKQNGGAVAVAGAAGYVVWTDATGGVQPVTVQSGETKANLGYATSGNKLTVTTMNNAQAVVKLGDKDITTDTDYLKNGAYEFSSEQLDGKAISVEFTLPDDWDVKKTPFALELSANEGGIIEAADNKAEFDNIQAVTLHLTPNDGFELDYITLSQSTGEDKVISSGFTTIQGTNAKSYTLSVDEVTHALKTQAGSDVKVLSAHAVFKKIQVAPPDVTYTVKTQIVGDYIPAYVSPAECKVLPEKTADFNFVPASGYENEKYITEVSIDNTNWTKVDSQHYSVFGVNADTTLYVRFTKDTSGGTNSNKDIFYNVNISTNIEGKTLAQGEIPVSPFGTVKVASEKSQAVGFFDVKGADGTVYKFSYAIVSKLDAAGNAISVERVGATANPNWNGTYTISFIQNNYDILAIYENGEAIDNTVEFPITVGEGGTVADGGKVLPSGSNVYVKKGGAPKSLTVTPDEGYVIDAIKVNGTTYHIGDANIPDGLIEGTIYSATVSLSADGAGATPGLEVTFAKKKQKVSIHTRVMSGSGDSSVSPNYQELELGADQMFTFKAASGYVFDSAWLCDSNWNRIGDNLQVSDMKFTMTNIKTDVYLACQFRQSSDPKPEKRAYEITTTTSAGGTISPSGKKQYLYENTGTEDNYLKLTVAPDLMAGYRLASLKLSGEGFEKDVTKDVLGDTYVLHAKDLPSFAAGEDVKPIQVQAVFEKPKQFVSVSISAGDGGRYTQATPKRIELGQPLAVTFEPDGGKELSHLELTFKDGNGTRTDIVSPTSANAYLMDPVDENLLSVRGIFKDIEDPSKPQAQKPNVSVNISKTGQGELSESGKVSIYQTQPTIISIMPDVANNYVLGSIVIKRHGEATALKTIENCEKLGRYFLNYAELESISGSTFADGGSYEFDVEFNFIKKMPVPDQLDVNVQLNVNISFATDGVGGKTEKDTVSEIFPKGDSDGNISVPYDSDEYSTFYLIPRPGYVLQEKTLSAVVNGTHIDIAVKTKDDFSDVPNDIADEIKRALSKQRAGEQAAVPTSAASGAVLSDGDAAKKAALSGIRYYEIKMNHIIGDMEVSGTLRPLLEGEDDSAMLSGTENPDVKKVTINVDADAKGGMVSPSGDQVWFDGQIYPFNISTDEGYDVDYVKITHKDGMVEILDDVTAGMLPVVFEEGLQVYVGFVEEPHGPGQVDVSIEKDPASSGTGTFSPSGSYSATVGSTETIEFTPDDSSYVKSITVNGVTTKLDPEQRSYPVQLLAGDDGKVTIRVNFGKSGDGHTVTPEDIEKRESYITAKITTEASLGGSISPEGTASSPITKRVAEKVDGIWSSLANSQSFVFNPDQGYMLQSVTVDFGGGNVYRLSDAELAARTYTVSNITADLSVSTPRAPEVKVTASFIPKTYTVVVGTDGYGDVYPSGRLEWPQGQNLYLSVTPKAGYKFSEFKITGVVAYNGVTSERAARESSLENQQDSVVDISTARAGKVGEGSHSFTLGSSGATITATHEKEETKPPTGSDDPTDPNNPSNPNDPTNPQGPGAQQPEKVYYKLTTKSSGNGAISPEYTEKEFLNGSTISLTLKPDIGYQPVSLTVTSGGKTTTVANTTNSYNYTISADTEIVANFAPIAVAGSNAPAVKTLRTLRSLAQTGDLNAPIMLMLMTVACGALGVAILMNGRNRRPGSSGAHRRTKKVVRTE